MAKKTQRVDINSLLKEKGLAKSGPVTISSNIESDINKYVSININKVMAKNYARIVIRQHVVDRLVEEGIESPPTVRRVDPLRDKDIPEGIEFILILGEHRFRAMNIIALNDSALQVQEFRLQSSSESKTDLDDIKKQFSENHTRSDMHLVEIGRLAERCLELGAFKKKLELANFLGLRDDTLSRALRCSKFISDNDFQHVYELNITSEDALLSISKLIELEKDWFALVQEYAKDEEGNFTPSLITSGLLKKILNDVNPKPPKAEVEAVSDQTQESTSLDQGVTPEAVSSEPDNTPVGANSPEVEAKHSNDVSDTSMPPTSTSPKEGSNDLPLGDTTAAPSDLEQDLDTTSSNTAEVPSTPAEEEKPSTVAPVVNTPVNEDDVVANGSDSESSESSEHYGDGDHGADLADPLPSFSSTFNHEINDNNEKHNNGAVAPSCFDENLAASPIGQKARVDQNVDMFIRGICFALESHELAEDLDGFINNINKDNLQSKIQDVIENSDLYLQMISKL